jgi:hypothetical protein
MQNRKSRQFVFGVEIRRRLMGEGSDGWCYSRTWRLSLAYDQANGDVTRTEQYNGAGVTGANSTRRASNVERPSGRPGPFHGRVVASKQVLILTPYIGAGYSRLMGDAEHHGEHHRNRFFAGTSEACLRKSSAKADDDHRSALGRG